MRVFACSARFTERQLASESNRFHVPPKRVEKLPSGVRRIQDVEREISRAEALLPQSAAEHVHGIVAARGRLGKHGVRVEDGSGLLYVRGGGLVSASAALRCGFFSSAIFTASRKRERVKVAVRCWPNKNPGDEE